MLRALILLAGTALALSGQQYRAFWADAYHTGYKTPQQVDQMVADVAAARGNAILIEVRIDGSSYYLKSLEPPVEDTEYATGFDALQYLIETAHARGIEVHAWFPVTKLWGRARPPRDPNHAWNLHGPQAVGDEMWMTVSNSGAISTSVDPGHPAALQYLADVILEPARHYDLDGIHLDYIRYPEDANYGWNPKAVERYQRLRNVAGTPAANDAAWGEFRREQVTALVRQIYLRAAAIRPSLKISAALITWGNGPLNDAEFRGKDAYSRVFQNWPAWLAEGIVDLAMPMNYFDNTRYSGYLDRWLEYAKNRQGRRALTPGLGVYLNTIPDSMDQTRRVLAPASTGTAPLGVVFYSYASTNNASQPNAHFYQAVADAFGDAGGVPALPWKSKPERGHLFGTLTVEGGGPAWMTDGAEVIVEAEGGSLPGPRRATTDGTGFFGFVDLPPDRYRVTVERAGVVVYRGDTGREVIAGEATRFDVRLPMEAFEPALPRFTMGRTEAAPNEVIPLTGNLPGLDRGLCQAMVNGRAAVLTVAPAVVMPNVAAGETWRIMIRCGGMESATVALPAAATTPRITGVMQLPLRYMSVYATGLGLVSGPLPYPSVVAPVRALVTSEDGREYELTPSFAAQIPMWPGAYLVNVQLPEAVVTGLRSIRLRAGDATSAEFAISPPSP